MQERPLTSPEGDSLFRFRLYSTEGVGLAVTQDERSYFLFDSAEYWSDLRQVSAPRELKCACKGHWFHATCLYHPTADGQDYRLLELRTQCAQCERTRTALSVEIDYGPTDSLYREPLSRCQAPDLKYRTRSLSSFWIPEDWLRAHYSGTRGKHCYDNATELHRLFGAS